MLWKIIIQIFDLLIGVAQGRRLVCKTIAYLVRVQSIPQPGTLTHKGECKTENLDGRVTKGTRRYDSETVEKFLGQYNPEPIKDRPIAIYVRVSSHEQKTKGDLERQKNRMIEHYAKNGYKVDY